MDVFSSRVKEIKEQMKAEGVTGAKAAEKIAKESRNTKKLIFQERFYLHSGNGRLISSGGIPMTLKMLLISVRQKLVLKPHLPTLLPRNSLNSSMIKQLSLNETYS